MSPNNPVSIGTCRCGVGQDLLLIAGPCALERETSPDIAIKLKEIVEELAKEEYRVQLVFKGSFDKANRTSIQTQRGPGIDAGLEILAEIREKTGLCVTTDVHETVQVERVANVVDLIQIPAFLARQTDLLVAAAKTGKPVHVKKGQFMAPQDMKHVVEKILASGNPNILLGERGTFFGYGALVNDFRSLVVMRSFGVPVVFDATHSVQQPSAGAGVTAGNREYVAPLARAAAAVGIDALFLETHFDPEQSPSDGPNMIPINQVADLIKTVLRIRQAAAVQRERDDATIQND